MGKDKAIEIGIGSSLFYEEFSIFGVELETELRRSPKRTLVETHPRNHHGIYPRRVKIPIFKGAFNEDANTHLARFEKMLCANHVQNDTARLELFPSSLNKEAFTWYTQFPTYHFQSWEAISQLKNSWTITSQPRKSLTYIASCRSRPTRRGKVCRATSVNFG